MKKKKKTITYVLIGFVALFCVIAFVMWGFDVHIGTYKLKSNWVDRVDRIEGYYVAVGTHSAGYVMEGENEIFVMGNLESYGDEVKGKHEETWTILPYKRFMCFSVVTDDVECYELTNADRTVWYGCMYVLRSSSGKIHYYYMRSGSLLFTATVSPYLLAEKISFNYNGETINLEEYIYFSSEIDFTKEENTLYIEDEPITFSR